MISWDFPAGRFSSGEVQRRGVKGVSAVEDPGALPKRVGVVGWGAGLGWSVDERFAFCPKRLFLKGE